MVHARSGDDAGCMTETHQQPYSSGPPPGASAPPPGWNTEHLRDYRRLRRSRLDRKVAGVSGGLAQHLNVDPTIIRVLFVVLVLFGGAGLLLYGALWLLVPEEGSERTVLSTSDSTRNALLIIALVVAGLIAVGNGLHGFGYPWLIAGALVVAAVLIARDQGRAAPPPPGGAQPFAPPASGSAGPPTPSAPAPPTVPLTGPPTVPPTVSHPVPPPLTGPPTVPPTRPPTPPWAPPGGAWQPAAPQRPVKRGPLLFGPTLALIALSLGVLGLYDASGGAVTDSAYPALALAITGVMLVVGAFVGRAGGLVAVGLLATLVLVATAIGRPSFHGDRNLVVRPASADRLQDHYEVPAGRVRLDLSRITDSSSLDGRSVEVSANAGELVVVVPRNVDVDYTADVQYGGAVDTPTLSRDGWAPSVTSTIDAPRTDDTLHLDLHLSFGHIEIQRADGIPVPQPAPQAPRSTR